MASSTSSPSLRRAWIPDGCVEVGLDEAGRGSLWGRLYVGAVILSPDNDDYPDEGELLRQITDSKKLSRKRRAVLATYIRENAVASVVTFADAAEVDRLNVLQADMAAMGRALDAIAAMVPVQRVLVDGDTAPGWIPSLEAGAMLTTDTVDVIPIVEGDAHVVSIAAASILAKEAHDTWVHDMIAADPSLHERYGFGTNMGYGTAAHIAGLQTWGAHAEHRRSFAPVRRVVNER